MATRDKEMQSTDCPVCHDKYSDPKILPCAHLLCRDCLVSWMKTKTDAPCPLCRSVIVDRKHSNIKNLDVFVDSLPTDHAMSAMVESLKIFSGKRVCQVHSNAVAISLCLDCNVKLCQGCIEVHRKLPLTSFHKIENLATLTPERLAANRQAPCSVHRDKTAELICVDHKVLICQLCATAKHRACSEVTYVSEVSGKYKQSLLEMESKLSAAESTLSQAITELEESLLKAEKSSNAALAEIDTTCDSLLKSVETCRKRLKKLVTEENDKMKAAVHEQKYIISHKRGRVVSHQGLIKRTLQMANDASLVAMVTTLESRVSDLDSSLPQDTNSFLMVTLKIDRVLISQVETELSRIIQPIFSFATGTEKNTSMFHNNCGSNRVLSSNGQNAEVKDTNDWQNRVLISREQFPTNKLLENTWMFHNNYGSNIVLSSNGQTAEVKDTNDWQNRVLISRKPVSTNKLYENTWMFHNNCGSNIVLSSNGQTAEVKDTNDWQNRVLISREPMSTNKLYEILVEEINTRYCGERIGIGVCAENPLSVTLPTVCCQMTTFVGVTGNKSLLQRQEFTLLNSYQLAKEYSCYALVTVKIGSHIGVMVDTSHSLHVYVDGKDQGVLAKNISQPCWAVFDLRYFLIKVSTLPVSSIQ